MIEQKEAAIEALDLPNEIITNFEKGDSKYEEWPGLPETPEDLSDHIQLPEDKVLMKEKVFKKHESLFTELQDYLYKKSGSVKRLQ